jgi:photosystem II stability/assembly factor-like uncharacterized protein
VLGAFVNLPYFASMKKILLLVFGGLLTLASVSRAQWRVLDVGTTAHFRAVHAPSPLNCWISGTKGTVLRTLDGGITWENKSVRGAEELDFRDIHAFDAQTVLVMSAGEAEKGKTKIFRTEDGGDNWQQVYETTRQGVFLDGMDFWDSQRGICFGDPVEGRFFILLTRDGGRTWREIPVLDRPEALPNEAAFAASGTSIVTAGRRRAYIGTGGGSRARVLITTNRGASWRAVETPLVAGASAGIFGLRFWTPQRGIAVGGDYRSYADSTANVLRTTNGGRSWELLGSTAPKGLKEAVALYSQNTEAAPLPDDETEMEARLLLLAVGASGSGYSADYGQSWHFMDHLPFHAVSVSGPAGYAVGGNGLVGKFEGMRRTSKKRTAR